MEPSLLARMPDPTTAPLPALVNMKLGVRGGSDDPNAITTCGYGTNLPLLSGGPGVSTNIVPMTCGPGYTCAHDDVNHMAGCHPPGLSTYLVNTKCIDSTEWASQGSKFAEGVGPCVFADEPFCGTVIFNQGGYTSWICAPFPGVTVHGSLATLGALVTPPSSGPAPAPASTSASVVSSINASSTPLSTSTAPQTPPTLPTVVVHTTVISSAHSTASTAATSDASPALSASRMRLVIGAAVALMGFVFMEL